METLTLRPTELDAGKRVDAWLPSQAEGLTRSAAQRLLEEGRVTLNGKPLAKNYKLTGGETLSVSLPDPEPPWQRRSLKEWGTEPDCKKIQ